MNKTKLIWLLAALLCLLTVISGCQNRQVPETYPKPTAYRPPANQFTYPQPQKDPLEDAYKADRKAFVVFTRSTEPRTKYVPIQQIMEYRTQNPDCNGSWYRSVLTGEDLCIYNAYFYAMEHGFTGFEMYVQDRKRDIEYIREAVALDSPFLEQNVSRYGEDKFERAPNWLGELISIHMDQFALDRMEQREYVVSVCRRIVSEMPATCVTDWEKAEYLYRYVCDHVQYGEYEAGAIVDYLYDAVWAGKTNCDGYSNMLSLLFNLAGIESSEAMGFNVEDLTDATREEAGGHTWVVAKLDGHYYNFDPTWEDTKGVEWGSDLAFFGYSDRLAPVKYLRCEQLRPKCTDSSRDFPYADLEVKDITSTKNIKAIAKVLEQRYADGQTTTVIAVPGQVTEKHITQFQKKVGNYLSSIKRAALVSRSIGTASVLWFTVKE